MEFWGAWAAQGVGRPTWARVVISRSMGWSLVSGRLRAVSPEPDAGLELTSREIMTRAGAGRSTDGATQAPLSFTYSKFFPNHNSLNLHCGSVR